MPFSLALRLLRPRRGDADQRGLRGLGRRRLRLAVVAGGLGALLAAPSAHALEPAPPGGWLVRIEDRDVPQAEPGRTIDTVGIQLANFVVSLGDRRPVVEILRDGEVIAAPPPGYAYSTVDLPDLRDGDLIRLKDYFKPSRVYLEYTYRRLPLLSDPLCAGAASYSGSRGVFAVGAPWAYIAELVPRVDYPPDPNYPFYPSNPRPLRVEDLSKTKAVVTSAPDRFTVVPSVPLVAGQRLVLNDLQRPGIDVEVETKLVQLVQDCPGPSPTPVPLAPPTPTPTPTATPAPQTQPVPGPAGDRTPPKITFTGPTTASLRKIGRAKLLRGGLPVKVVSDEPARIVGTLTLLGGKRPFVSSVDQPVIKGTTITELVFSRTMRRLVTTTRNARLRLEAAIVDAAGNRTPLPTITVKVPRR